MKTKSTLSMKRKQGLKRILMTVTLLAICAVPVFAADPGEAEFYAVILFIAGWVSKLGLVIALFGAIQTIGAFKNDDAGAKETGLKVLISGFMLFGITFPATIKMLFSIG